MSLILTPAFAHFIAVQLFVTLKLGMKALSSLVGAGLPAFFAEICFSRESVRRPNAGGCLCWKPPRRRSGRSSQDLFNGPPMLLAAALGYRRAVITGGVVTHLPKSSTVIRG